MTRTTRAAAVLFVLLCAAWYIRVTVVDIIPSLGRPSDFEAYYNAARQVMAGHSPFANKPYIYPPLLAFVLAPFSGLPYLTARWIWFLFSQACLLAGGWLTWKTLGRDWIAASAVAFVWAVGGAAVESLALGQPGPELMLLATVAIVKQNWRAAVAVAAGLAIKMYPGVLAVWFVLRRQWRMLSIFIATTIALVLIPWSAVLCCLDGPRTPGERDTWSGTPLPLSWGLPSVLLRAIDPPAPNGPLPPDWQTDIPYLRLPASHRWSAMGVAAFTLLAGIAVLSIALRRSPAAALPGFDRFAMAALVSLSLAASPVCWTHYQVVQYPGVALLLCHAARSRKFGLFAAALALGALLYPLPVAVLTDYYVKYGKWTVSLPKFYFWTSIAPFASLGLFGLFVREAGRPAPVCD